MGINHNIWLKNCILFIKIVNINMYQIFNKFGYSVDYLTGNVFTTSVATDSYIPVAKGVDLGLLQATVSFNLYSKLHLSTGIKLNTSLTSFRGSKILANVHGKTVSAIKTSGLSQLDQDCLLAGSRIIGNLKSGMGIKDANNAELVETLKGYAIDQREFDADASNESTIFPHQITVKFNSTKGELTDLSTLGINFSNRTAEAFHNSVAQQLRESIRTGKISLSDVAEQKPAAATATGSGKFDLETSGYKFTVETIADKIRSTLDIDADTMDIEVDNIKEQLSGLRDTLNEIPGKNILNIPEANMETVKTKLSEILKSIQPKTSEEGEPEADTSSYVNTLTDEFNKIFRNNKRTVEEKTQNNAKNKAKAGARHIKTKQLLIGTAHDSEVDALGLIYLVGRLVGSEQRAKVNRGSRINMVLMPEFISSISVRDFSVKGMEIDKVELELSSPVFMKMSILCNKMFNAMRQFEYCHLSENSHNSILTKAFDLTKDKKIVTELHKAYKNSTFDADLQAKTSPKLYANDATQAIFGWFTSDIKVKLKVTMSDAIKGINGVQMGYAYLDQKNYVVIGIDSVKYTSQNLISSSN